MNFDFEAEYKKTAVPGGFAEEHVVLTDRRVYSILKRMFDIGFAVLGIAVLLMVFAAISLLILFTSPGPVFYYQDRLGHNGKPFKIIKFRTMKINAEEETGPVLAEENDSRVTDFGRFLRTTHLDELPQLFNILKGEMSFVGPRPERECFYREFAKYIDGFEQRLLVPQGLTGFAQVSGGYDLPPEKKIVYDLNYIKRPSLLFDFAIILRTISGTIRDIVCCPKHR